MIGYFAALMMLAEPAAVAVEQLDQNPATQNLAPVEQVSRGDNSAFVDQKPAPGEKPENLPQLSATDTEVTLGRVDGIDRCSAELLSAKDAEYCLRRIETRSEEFATRPAGTLTAEQRLLGERLTILRGTGIDQAARAPGVNASADDRELQALASITLTVPTAEPAAEGKPADGSGDLSAETQALLDAIVARLANPNPGGN